MSETRVDAPVPIHESDSGGNTIDLVLRWAVIFCVLMMLCLVIYGLVAGIFRPAAPRTLAEATLRSSEAAIKKNPASGTAWAQYIRSLYMGGDKKGAWDSLKKARKSVKDESVRWLNATEVDMLIRDGKNDQALKLTTDYIAADIKIRDKQKLKDLQNNINVPVDAMQNDATIRMFLLRATAEGNLKKYKDAVEDLSNALKLQPQAADIITMRGWAYLRAGDKKAAKTDFERARLFLPDDTSIAEGLKAVAATSTAK